MFGLVIMNTAVSSSSLALKSSRSTRPRASLLIVTASNPARLRRGRVGAVGAVGDQDLGPLLALVAEVGRGDRAAPSARPAPRPPAGG